MSPTHPGGRQTLALPPEILSTCRDLYIVSSCAAQLGGYGLEVPKGQWRALMERTERARTAFDSEPSVDGNALALSGRLLLICEYLIELHRAGLECPPALWREAGRLGHEAYLDLDEA